ncbi:cyclin PHO80-like protein, partial [Kipferlia bialata]
SPKSPRPDRTIEAVASILHQVIRENERYVNGNKATPKLKCTQADIDAFLEPDTSLPTFKGIYKYLYTLCYRTRLRNEAAIAILVYVDRLIEKTNAVVAQTNWRLVVLSSLIAAQKFWDDFCFSNADYSKLVPGLSITKINSLERKYMRLIDFDLNVSPTLYHRYWKHLQRMYKDRLSIRQAFPASPMPSPINCSTALHGINHHRGVALPKRPVSELSLRKRVEAQRAKGQKGRPVTTVHRQREEEVVRDRAARHAATLLEREREREREGERRSVVSVPVQGAKVARHPLQSMGGGKDYRKQVLPHQHRRGSINSGVPKGHSRHRLSVAVSARHLETVGGEGAEAEPIVLDKGREARAPLPLPSLPTHYESASLASRRGVFKTLGRLALPE